MTKDYVILVVFGEALGLILKLLSLKAALGRLPIGIKVKEPFQIS
jgi:hypothetical protein